ncbi:MAG: hypothetical protein COV67_05530 [Nitrospinae bacterium CG11_big_fil_rev_8_21_14_0_20_56_8]|nr:MAG: hypothetical protein COV67_05530 [Nitrospinae bacterium CG11_big_fil_rev_8_21_14_0_20_56_8]
MPPSSPRSRVRWRMSGMVLLVLAPTLLYLNSLGGEFQFDDRNLVDRPWTANLEEYFQSVDPLVVGNRPVLLWTIALNNSLHPHQTFGFHLLNLLLHLWVTVLVYVVLLKTQELMDSGEGRDGMRKEAFAFVPALIFSAHPLNTDAVSYIVSRSTLLATLFYLLTLYGFLHLFDRRETRFPRRVVQGFWIVWIAAGFYLALGSKLTAVTLPAALLAWFILFFAPSRFPRWVSMVFNRNRVPYYLIAAGFLVAFAWFAEPLLYRPRDQGMELFGRWNYFLHQPKVIVFYYLRLFLFPFNLNVDPGFPATSWSGDGQIGAGFLLLLLWIVAAFRWGNVWIKAGTVWFLLTLAPTSSFVPLNDLAVEHRTYLPLTLGLCPIAGWLVVRWLEGSKATLAVVAFAGLCVLTIHRNQDWTTEIRLWQDAAEKNPRSPRPHNNLGKAYYEAEQLGPALVHFKRSILNEGFNTALDLMEPHFNIAAVYLDLNRLDDAEREYREVMRLRPGSYESHMGLATVMNRRGNFAEAERLLLRSLELKRAQDGADFPLARLNLGELYGKTARYREAVTELKMAIAADPGLLPAHYNLGTAYLALGRPDLAARAYQICLLLDPTFAPALQGLERVTREGNVDRVNPR